MIRAARSATSASPSCASHGDRVDNFRAQVGEQLELKRVDRRQEAGSRHEVRIGLQHAADVPAAPARSERRLMR